MHDKTAVCIAGYKFAGTTLVLNTTESSATVKLERNVTNWLETIAKSHSSKGPLHTVHFMGSDKLFIG